MRRLTFILIAFLLAGILGWGGPVLAAGTPTNTVSSLMNVLKENKQKAVYNINLNAPFAKADSGVNESVNSETGEVSIVNTVFDIPGRNGMDLTVNLEYRSRDAKAFNEGMKSGSVTNSYGQNVVAWYDVFDANGYWLKTGGLVYPANDTILNETTINGQKWVFTGQMQYEGGTSLFTSGSIVNTTIEKSRDNAAKYVFGLGWSLDIPTLEVDDSSVYVELPNGQTYKADFAPGTGLSNYELNDIVFTKDTTYGNGVDTSAYKLLFADGDVYYYSAKGEILVQRDRYNNAIRYYYGDVNGLRLVTKIVDSAGRAVDIQYNDTVTIFKCGDRSVKLVKTPIPGQPGKFYLSSFIDAQGRTFRYNYTFQNAGFDQVGGAASSNLYANLIEINYPTGAKTQYVWDKGKKNIGTNGNMEYFKVRERKDIAGGRTYNLLKYQYFNEPDGYPTYKATGIDDLYKYYSVVTDSKGLKTKYQYNAKHLLTSVQTSGKRLYSESLTNFHLKYKLPTKVTTKEYDSEGDVFETVDLYEFDNRGNVVAENHPESSKKIDDEHKTYYTYDYRYNLLVNQKYKQDKNTTVEEKYTLTSDGKSPATITVVGNKKGFVRKDFRYDNFGNLIQERTEKQPGEWVSTRYEYGSEYKSTYLTAQIFENVKDADGFTRSIRTSNVYDFKTGNRISETDGNSNTTYYQYDKLDRITKQTNPDKSYQLYQYDDANNILSATDANGHQLVYYYGSLGSLLKVEAPEQKLRLVEMEYDDKQNLIAERNGNGTVKSLDYDDLGRLEGVSHRDKKGTQLANTIVKYDEAFQDRLEQQYQKITVTKIGDKANQVTNYYYDLYDRLVKLGRINKGKEETASSKYNYLSNTIETTDFAGQKSTAQYDALGRPVKITDPLGGSVKYNYDALGNMVSTTNALGQTVHFEYDNLGRKITEKAPFEKDKFSVTKFYYDNNNNLIKAVDPEDFVTKQYFNNMDNLTATERVIDSRKSNITKFEYDKEGNITKVLKGLNSIYDRDFSTTSYQYDSLNRLVMMADAANQKTYYKYDGNSNLIKLTDRNKVSTTFTYDGLDRLVEKRNSKDGSKNAIKITYDKLGQTRRMTDASGTTVFEYDDLGRLTKIDYGNGIRQNYAYDNADRIANMKVMQGNLSQIDLKYGYDKAGRLAIVNDGGKRFTYKYNQIGQLVEELNGVTGIKSTYQYYPSGNMKSLRHFNGQNIVSGYEYKYDKRGNQIEKNEGTGSTRYYYDALSRIKTAIMPEGKTQNYEYDDLDNIKELTEINGTKIEETKYTYDKNNRLLLQESDNGSEVKQNRFTYDLAGNQLTKDEVVKRNGSMVSSKSYQYWYDGFNQLQRVQDANGKFTDYIYNGTGLRTKKDFGDRAINYIYDRGNIIIESDQDNKVTAKNIRGLKLIYRETNPNSADPTYLYYLHNARGDVTQLLNEKGDVIKDYRYDPFGKEQPPEFAAYGGNQAKELWRQEVEKIDNPFRYCGEYQDEETGNYYLRARYYDPSTQRFINEDSYGISYGAAWKQDLYSYVGNNPLNYQDPSGHLPEIINKITKSLYHSYKAGKTYIRARRTSNGKESVELARIAYANGGSVWFDSKTKQAAITLNGQTRWFSTKNWYTENGHIWINPETFNKMFGIKGTGQIINASKVPKTYTEKDGVKTPTRDLPTAGEPNSKDTLYNPDGTPKQDRWYGPDGNALKDRDYNHGGVGHEFPHDHEWEDGERQPGVPVPKPSTNPTEISNWKTAGIAALWFISEASRAFPPRNLIPVP